MADRRLYALYRHDKRVRKPADVDHINSSVAAFRNKLLIFSNLIKISVSVFTRYEEESI